MGRGSRNSGTFWRDRYKRVTFRVITFKVSREALEVIDKAARSLGMNRSELIRAALSEFLRRHANVDLDLDDWPVIPGRPLEVTLP